MYSVIVVTKDGDEYLLPCDEYPGTILFDEEVVARQVARQVVGLGLSQDGDEEKIVAAYAVELRKVEN